MPPDPSRTDGLRAALASAVERLPNSAGAAYLTRRGISPHVAAAHGIGWGGADGRMRGRVVFPLCAPDGSVTSATGRAVADDARPKYWTLPISAGYPKGWFNGAAIARAAADGLPLYVCEGPFDALALLAGGVPTAVAVLGVTGVRAEWLVGVRRAVLCFDGDAAGQAARAELAFAAGALGVTVELMPTGALAGCNDVAEHWERHGALPAPLIAHWKTARELAAPGGYPRSEPFAADEPSPPAGAAAALAARLETFTDDELRAYRGELEAAPPDDPASPTEWTALHHVERRRGWAR